MSPTPKLLIVVGAFLLVAGLLLHLGGRLGLGRLPGDITLRGRDVTVYLPIATSLLLSILLTLVASFLLRPHR